MAVARRPKQHEEDSKLLADARTKTTRTRRLLLFYGQKQREEEEDTGIRHDKAGGEGREQKTQTNVVTIISNVKHVESNNHWLCGLYR